MARSICMHGLLFAVFRCGLQKLHLPARQGARHCALPDFVLYARWSSIRLAGLIKMEI